MNAISHCDIKPANIMKLHNNKYALGDYGEGMNLSYEKALSEDCFYQIGAWKISGTIPYMDPILIKKIENYKKGNTR